LREEYNSATTKDHTQEAMEQAELVSPLTDGYSRNLVHDHSLFTAITGGKSPRADHGGRTVQGVEIRPLA
jgi:hypothetical protein